MDKNVTIVDVVEADLSQISALTSAALEPDLLSQFLWGNRRAEAEVKETESLTRSLGARFTSPTNRCHILKAVDSADGEILGWTLVRWEDGSWPLTPASAGTTFAAHYSRAVKTKWAGLVGGKPHVVLGAIHVKPDRQGQGIGRLLIEHIYRTFDLHKELVVLQTRAMSEGFYLRLGWKTVSCTEIDLSEWGGKGRGYGVHRSPQMLRYPIKT